MKTPEELQDLIVRQGLEGPALKSFFRNAVQNHWPPLPVFSTLTNGPVIEEVAKSSEGSGAVLTWKKNGVRKVLLGQTGKHYEELYRKNPKNTERFPISYTIPGGFMTATGTKGSSLVPASDKSENAYIAAAREIEEEFKDADGKPLLNIDPARLKIMDTDAIGANGNYMTVMGLMLELNEQEIEIVEAHVERLATDPAYKQACALATNNEDTGLPEIDDKEIFDLDDVMAGKVNIFHKDQHSLFRKVHQHFYEIENPKKRLGPTLAYEQKVKTLEELAALVDEWRSTTNSSIGVTTGVFDILHPGHISFLHDASRECGRLIAIIASDRTVRELKGEEKPMVSEIHRAQSIAALSYIDAVIISDSFYHEDILDALRPEIMFKGHDYAGKSVYGADKVGTVMIIPCAEDKFYSSSQLIKHIWNKKPDTGPAFN